jgi:uncharacterized repeat protein (TIGR01451 family)
MVNTRSIKEKTSRVFFFLLAVIVLPGSMFAATLNVCTACTYTTVAAALAAAAASGDTVVLTENITEDCVMPGNYAKNVAITSDGTRRTWTNTSGNNLRPNNIDSAGVLNVSNIDFVNTGGSELLNLDNLKTGTTFNFTNCTFSNTTASGKLVRMQNGGYLNLYECELVGNNLTSVGIDLENGVNPTYGLTMHNTIIRGISNGVALREGNSTGDVIRAYNCTFEGNSVAYEAVGPNTVRNCLFINNDNDLLLTNINAWSNAGMCSTFQYCSFHEALASYSDGGAKTWTGYTGIIFGTPDSIVVDIAAHNLHLVCSDTTYAVDKGATMTFTDDKDYEVRPQGTAYDIGAYECPGISALKSADVSYAYMGDTINFCITVTNNTTNDVDTSVWDTVPAQMTYIGCDNGCAISGAVVSWFISLGAGQNRMLCFWARVTSYPFIIRQGEFFAGVEGLEQKTVISKCSVFAIDDWKYWMAFSGNNAVKKPTRKDN